MRLEQLVAPRVAAALVVAMAGACSGHGDEPAPTPAPSVHAGPSDAATPQVGGSDPGFNTDDGAQPRPSPPPPLRHGPPIDITLRSTPTAAQVSVDGTLVGTTPAYWRGEANGAEHEFVFVLPRHGIARYRFVPITSGVIHARLEPIAEDKNAGAPPPEVVPRPQVAPPVAAPGPGPTPPAMVAPIDAPAPAPAPAPMPGIGPQP